MSTSTTIIMAIIISFAVSVILCPIVIPILKKMKFGQYIREVGPKSHQSKTGTPTMGGMIILAGVIVTSLIFMIVEKNTKIAPVLFMTVGFGLIGFIDDYIKVVKKRNLGLTEIQKFSLQVVVTAVFCVYMIKYIGSSIIAIAITFGLSAGAKLIYEAMYLPEPLGNFCDVAVFPPTLKPGT